MSGFGTYDTLICWSANAVRKGDASPLRRVQQVISAIELYDLERSYPIKKDHPRPLRISRQKKQRWPNYFGHSPRPANFTGPRRAVKTSDRDTLPSLDGLLKLLGRPERHFLAGLDLDLLTRCRIAAHPLGTLLHLQCAEAAHPDPSALS